MVDYDIKRGWFSKIDEGGLEKIMKETFGNVKVKDGIHTSEYGVLESIEAEIMSKSAIRVETVNADIPAGEMKDEDILDAKRKLNVFVEAVTGFDVKARKKRAQDKAKKGF
ncbi:MAG: DUF5611 family protein [Candidatus Methanomethylophilaceae archaeon]|jgi:hypothetical protein